MRSRAVAQIKVNLKVIWRVCAFSALLGVRQVLRVMVKRSCIKEWKLCADVPSSSMRLVTVYIAASQRLAGASGLARYRERLGLAASTSPGFTPHPTG